MTLGTVMLVGAGRFGANYPRVLDEVNTGMKGQGREMPFERLVVTRTRLSAAREASARIIAEHPSFLTVEGAEVTDSDQLSRALEHYQPALICITARDRRLGDAIHARYVPVALDYGAVLCEKPFSTSADALAFTVLQNLTTHPRAHRFGLHLPMAVVREAMLSRPGLGARLRSARRIEFLWEKMGNGDDLLADLALHPWSLIPRREDLHVSSVHGTGKRIDIGFRTPHAAGRMILDCNGSFRGMCLDNQVLRFEFKDGKLHVLSCAAAWPDIIGKSPAMPAGTSILSVPNPLKAHILAVLEGRPIVDLADTLQSQRFLAQSAAVADTP